MKLIDIVHQLLKREVSRLGFRTLYLYILSCLMAIKNDSYINSSEEKKIKIQTSKGSELGIDTILPELLSEELLNNLSKIPPAYSETFFINHIIKHVYKDLAIENQNRLTNIEESEMNMVNNILDNTDKNNYSIIIDWFFNEENIGFDNLKEIYQKDENEIETIINDFRDRVVMISPDINMAKGTELLKYMHSRMIEKNEKP